MTSTPDGVVDSCIGEMICDCGSTPFCDSGGTCVAAFGRRYRIGVSRILFPERRPDGECWDASCGAPDPYFTLSVDGSVEGMVPAASDLFEGFWDPPATFEVTILAGSSVRFDAYDEDLSDDDGAFSCVHDPVTAERLRSRSLSCTGALGEIDAVVVYVP